MRSAWVVRSSAQWWRNGRLLNAPPPSTARPLATITSAYHHGRSASSTTKIATRTSHVRRRVVVPLRAFDWSSAIRWQSSSSTSSNDDKDDTKRTDDDHIHDDNNNNNTPTTTMEEVTHSDSPKAFILDLGIPRLIPEWRRMWRTETFFTDVAAGLTVGCIAVPLSLAIALASGVPAEVGLVTAAVSGVAGGLFGGTTLAVTGPAAAISLLIVEAVNQHGLSALPLITLSCGALQLASGVTRLGVIGKLVPVSVIAGFTTGVGTLILTGQLPKALGMHAPAGLNPLDLLAYIGTHLTDVSPAAAALALGTSAAMYFLPKVHGKIPAALLAVGGATAATHTLGLDVTLIGTIPSGLSAFQCGLPVLPEWTAWPSLAGTILLIYSMTSVESLLSCAALDKMRKTSMKYNADQELIGQGLANMGSALFMGMPVTSVIARSGLNVRLNAQTRLPALVQAGFVFSSVVFFSQSIAMIPMPALSGMLITTGMGMLTPAEFKHCYAVQRWDVLPFATTVAGMITFGLAEGIGLGCVSAVALSYAVAHDAAHARLHVYEQVPSCFVRVPGLEGSATTGATRSFHQGTVPPPVWQLHGPINFLSMFEIDDLIKRIERRRKQNDGDDNKDDAITTTTANAEPILLDMQNVTHLEFTGVEELVTRVLELEAPEVRMLNCSTTVLHALDQCDPKQQIVRDVLDVTFQEKTRDGDY